MDKIIVIEGRKALHKHIESAVSKALPGLRATLPINATTLALVSAFISALIEEELSNSSGKGGERDDDT